MGDGHRLVSAMRRAAETPQNEVVDIVVGEVTSISPLKVKIETRELTESFLIVGELCKERHIYTPNIKKLGHHHVISSASTEDAGDPEHSHELKDVKTDSEALQGDFDILLWRGLNVGDKVLMLKVARGQKYYIMQRVEEVTKT